MPGGDGTGPAGAGSKTGRGMGDCAGISGPGKVNPSFGRGRGMGRGMGRGRGGSSRGFGMRWWSAPNAESDKDEKKKDE